MLCMYYYNDFSSDIMAELSFNCQRLFIFIINCKRHLYAVLILAHLKLKWAK